MAGWGQRAERMGDGAADAEGDRPVVVTICGGSGSGKSTLAAALAAELADLRPVVLEQDWYFRDFDEYDADVRESYRTANHPDAVLWPAFHAALESLAAGGTAKVPAPGTRRFRQSPVELVGPGGLLIVVGLFTLWDRRCRSLADLRLFTEVNDDERVLRRLSRDVVSRGTTVERAVAWYRHDVQPNYPTYTAAFRARADLVVPTTYDVTNAVRAVGLALRGLAGRPADRPPDRAGD